MTTTSWLLLFLPHHPHHPPTPAAAANQIHSPWPWKKKTCKFYLKILCCILFLLVYVAIFLHESINATKLKQRVIRQVGGGKGAPLLGQGAATVTAIIIIIASS